MLLPHQWAVVTVEEAQKLVEYIEQTTATKTKPRNYDKMREVGILETYNKMREIVDYNQQYKNNLQYYDFAQKRDYDGQPGYH